MEWIEISIDLKNIGMENSLIQKKNNWDKFFLSSDEKKDKMPGCNVKLENQIVLIRYTYYLLPSDFFLHKTLVSHVRYMHLQICLSNAAVLVVGIRIQAIYLWQMLLKSFSKPISISY